MIPLRAVALGLLLLPQMLAAALPATFDQDDLNAGGFTEEELFYGGARLFAHRFTREDGFGEAPDGPRLRVQRLAGNVATQVLRINGLDAQSCQECHFQLGQQRSTGLPRELGTLGSAAGVAANVMIFKKPDNLREGIVRNPPHLFGVGYVQKLSDEMTEELVAQAKELRRVATESGEPIRAELRTKGLSFGFLTVGPTGAPDTSELRGVSSDLVIRPFQFKGIASSLRNFVAGALNFHFSVQPRELMERRLILNDNPTKSLAGDVEHEIGEGEVTAIAYFLAALRPPVQDAAGLDAEKVARGRALMDLVSCTECHVPALPIEDPFVKLVDPRHRFSFELDPPGAKWPSALRVEELGVNMVASEPDSRLLDPMILAEAKGKGVLDEVPGVVLDLNSRRLPDEAYPRLLPGDDGRLHVPLFSDLRRHRMGKQLADTTTQPVDMQNFEGHPEEFVTRSLWGVADTGPWLHDGRAFTLREAIEMHAGDGSEANASIAEFTALAPEDQEALLEFLRSLRQPPMGHAMEPGVRHREGLMLH